MLLDNRIKIESMLSQILNKDIEEIKKLDTNDNLLTVGLTSIKAISLVVLIEQSYDLALEDDEFFFENLNTISKIEKLIRKYT